MENLILIDKNDLREIIAELIPSKEQTCVTDDNDEKSFMTLDETVEYLSSKGLRISKSTLYKKTSSGEIPCHHWGGRRVVFLKNEIDEWISKQFQDNKKADNSILKAVAASARKKEA